VHTHTIEHNLFCEIVHIAASLHVLSQTEIPAARLQQIRDGLIVDFQEAALHAESHLVPPLQRQVLRQQVWDALNTLNSACSQVLRPSKLRFALNRALTSTAMSDFQTGTTECASALNPACSQMLRARKLHLVLLCT